MMFLEGMTKCAATAAAVLVLTGCASFQRNQLPSVGHLRPPAEGTKKASVGYAFSSGVDIFGEQECQEKVRAQLEQEFVDVLKESGYFTSVSPGDQGEMRMQIRLINSGNPAVMITSFITGFSLFTIPSWATDKYNMTARVVGLDGKERAYNLADSMTTVLWLPMIVITPFKNMVNVSKEVRRNIWKNLIIKMQQDGVLPAPGSAGHTSILTIQLGEDNGWMSARHEFWPDPTLCAHSGCLLTF